MDDNTRLIMELARSSENQTEEEPMLYDLQTLLENERKRMLTPEGERLIREARRDQPREETHR